MAVNYVHHVAEIGRRLEEKWPGIFLMAEGLTGGQRDLIVALMRGRTTITGGAEDGLNLVIMESSFINRDRPTGLIAGENIGFVLDNPTHRANGDFLTFRPGSISELVQKIRQVAKLQEQNPGRLVEAKRALNVSIAQRDASMLLDE
jgi:hypothetical protein